MNKTLVMAAAGVLLVAAAPAFAGTDFTKAITEGKVSGDARVRYENVDTTALDDANAFTAGARLGYTTGDFYGVSGMVEFEGVSGILNEDYNDTVNGKVGQSTVADPETAEVNQAFLQYSNFDSTLRAGRQTLENMDNGRWVGSDTWRQNHTSYDAVLLQTKALKGVTATYAYVGQLNTNIGSEATTGTVEHDSHLLNVSTDLLKFLTVSGYGYFLDSDEIAAQGSTTWGVRGAGEYAIDNAWRALYSAEWANQEDAGDNAASYDLNYYALEGGVGYKSFTAKVGYEVAEADGVNGIVAPFSDAHKFNGGADVIGLSNGGVGLEDLYVGAHVEVAQVNPWVDGLNICAEWHDFTAENGGADLGTEWNVGLNKDFGKHYNAGVYFFSYDADTFGADTDKFIVEVSAKI